MNASAFSEPFTPRGVAAFGRAKWSRLFIAQLVCASLVAAVVAWFFYKDCFPTVLTAIENLPATGQIQSGRLDWNGVPQFIAEGHFLAVDVDPEHSGQLHSTADVQIEFGRESLRLISLFGYADLPYPPNEMLSFNRTELEPLWSAWRAVILFFITATTFIALLVIWWILATIYFLPVWLLGFFTNRDLSLRASWKTSCAALLPCAFLMMGGIFLYAVGFFTLVVLCFVFAAHFVLDWLYLFFGLFFFSRTPAAPTKGNPFNLGKNRKN